MKIIKDEFHRLLDPYTTLTLMGEGMLERIVEDPGQPLLEQNEKGYGIETIDTYDTKTSFLDICRAGKAMGAKRIDVSYDFFFGGDSRENYPDTSITVKAYKIIHDLAKEHGMGFCASVVSPLDIGGEYVKTHEKKGQTMQFKEGLIKKDGSYETDMDYQSQWTNNKGPAKVTFKEVKVFAFDEERIEGTPFYYVNENEIEDISDSVQYHMDSGTLRVSRDGYGHGDIRIKGKTACGKTRFLAVIVYDTLEIDYFFEDALDYMKSIIDLHAKEGITYDGIYSDEMHIQFDWDTREHWGETEVTTRYMTESMANAYADKYGSQYRDFTKYLVYFTYMHHDFLEGEEGRIPAQHVFGKCREDIVRTFLFRKNYFDMLHRRVVDLCTLTKQYAEELFGHKLEATGHSTWQESPTTDTFYTPKEDEDPWKVEHSRYDYTQEFVWSAAQRENISACNDHFKWNEYFWSVGTDIPEGGFLDRNYYGAAYTSGLAALNASGVAYYCIWGSPDQIKERQMEIGQTYGHYAAYAKSYEVGHNMIQGYNTRVSDIITLCPMDLNYMEERFGNWMVQYGYTDYITEEKLVENAKVPEDAFLKVGDRSYRALMVFFSPLTSRKVLELIQTYVKKGGTVIWCSAPALQEADEVQKLWKEIFGIKTYEFKERGIPAKEQVIHFDGMKTVEDMQILTNLFPDYVYPVAVEDAKTVASLQDDVTGVVTVGTIKEYQDGGKAAYFGFRVRDDQSHSTGSDVNTLFSILCELGCYSPKGCEISSRPEVSRYIYNRFPNGAVTLCNHFRTFRELPWPWGFYRDEEKDNEFMKDITFPPHDINLNEMEVNSHKVTYQGEGIVTYIYEEEAGLKGLVGRNTCGICIDGKNYSFTKEPIDIVWGIVDRRILDGSVEQAYVLKCNKTTQITLPFDAQGMKCALCSNYMLDTVDNYPYEAKNGTTVVDIDVSAVEKWIVFFK